MHFDVSFGFTFKMSPTTKEPMPCKEGLHLVGTSDAPDDQHAPMAVPCYIFV